MTGNGRAAAPGLRKRAARCLMLALPVALLTLAAAAFALAPRSTGRRAGARPDLGLLPPTPRASAPAQATHGRSPVGPAVASGDGRALSRPQRPVQRRRAGR